ncbi:MAG TPA: DUF2339 domain-containing protein [Burkholderiales bacterium]|nr:DUF2339 domain-containing protein [Burkholderiales bacterium]
MWFIGLFIGLLLGSMLVGGGYGMLWGGLLGAVAGAMISYFRGQSRGSDIETRIAALEAAVTDLRQKFSQASGRPMPAEDTQPASASETPYVIPQLVSEEIAPVRDQAGTEEGIAQAADKQITPAPIFAAPVSSQPAEPSYFDRAWNWLTGGNSLVRVGVVVLFFGVGFLLKYAYEHTHLPIEVRLIGVALGAAVMLVIGWRLRERKPVYALAMQGGGVGLLYLTVFGAFRLFNLIPGEVAFLVLVAIAVLSAVLAVVQNALSLAVLGVSGGFLAPVLASTGGGSHVMLFSYYAVLNAGVLGIALYRAWRPLNVLGFVFTFGIGAMWGARYYRPDLFESTEPFLLLFFLQYVAIAVLFALRQVPQLKHYVDSTIVFGTPLVGFGLQSRLVHDIEYGAAWSAVAVSAIYLVLASGLYRRHAETLRMLVEAFLALGVIFATLAIPLAFDGRWTSAAWALEGAAAYWVGVKQGRRLPRAFGLLLQFAAGVAFIVDAGRTFSDTPILNSFYLGCVFIAAAALFSNWTLGRQAEKTSHLELQVSIIVFVWGVAWWTFAGLHEIDLHVPFEEKLNATLLFVTGTCAAFSALWGRTWAMARFPALALMPLMLLVFCMSVVVHPYQHPLAGFGLMVWPVAFLFHLRILRRHDAIEGAYMNLSHAAGVWLLAAVGAWEVGWQIDHVVEGRHVWPLIAWALVPGGLLATLALKGDAIAWPVMRYPKAYLWVGALPLAAFLLGWTVYANFGNDGNPEPLPYVPLLNPLDIAQLLVFACLAMWWRGLPAYGIGEAARIPASWPRALLGGAAFLFLNGVLLRTLHHWAGIPYQLDAMLRSDLAQASLSVFWTVLALVAMLWAHRRGLRVVWFSGAGLMAAVVVKLFLVDLAKVGGVERIVSFIAVGVLMLVIGYFAPLPPKKTENS